MRLSLIEPFALRHHGLVTINAVRTVGLSRSTWLRAIDGGQLELIHPGVARIVGSPPTREQAIAAAVLPPGRALLRRIVRRRTCGVCRDRPPTSPS